MNRPLTTDHQGIVQPLLRWFRKTDRKLPWRRTYNPYHIWISEIMLQQTQMERGVAYFLRWLGRFPDVQAVAAAKQQDILKYWEGLGYYARARNLHRAAKLIVGQFGGEVPCEYQALLTLPGIGPYTAAAIASVAGNYDIPVIDANVARVYARLFDIADPIKERRAQARLTEIAARLLPPGQARAYNQALMDLGGLVCTPKNPCCSRCPVAVSCLALRAGTVAVRPVVGSKKAIVTVHRMAGLILWQGQVFIQQRQAKAVWGGLWEFPGGQVGEGAPDGQVVAEIMADTGLSVALLRPITTVAHQYTHHKVFLRCCLCTLEASAAEPRLRSASGYRWVNPEELEHFAFPAGPRKLLEYIRANEPQLLGGDP